MNLYISARETPLLNMSDAIHCLECPPWRVYMLEHRHKTQFWLSCCCLNGKHSKAGASSLVTGHALVQNDCCVILIPSASDTWANHLSFIRQCPQQPSHTESICTWHPIISHAPQPHFQRIHPNLPDKSNAPNTKCISPKDLSNFHRQALLTS